MSELKEKNIQETKKSPFGVWVVTLQKYLEGKPEGEWIYFPQEEAYLKEEEKRIAGTKKDDLIIFNSDYREDCKYMMKVIGGVANLSDLNVIAKLIGDEPHPAVEAYLLAEGHISLPELANLFMQESEIPYFPYEFDGKDNPGVMLSEEEKRVYTYMENLSELGSALKNLQINGISIMNYLDMEAIGANLSLNGIYLTEHGYYDERMKAPNLSLYTMEQIKEELAQQEQQVRQEEQAQQEQKEQQEKETAVHKEQRQKPPLSPSI